MKDKLLRFILPAGLIAVLVITWQLLSDYSIINPALFSSPKDIALAFFDEPGLYNHILSSLYRLFISVIIGFPLGALVGIAVSKIRKVSFIEDIISFFMSIPGISWAPIFIIIMGFGDKTIILVGLITSFFPALYNMIHGFKAIDRNILRVSELLEFSILKKIFQVYIPSTSTYLLVGLKESFARTWRTIIAVEMIAATLYGLGYMTFDARELLNSSTMFLGIVLSGLIYMLIEIFLIGTIEKNTVVKWGMKGQQ